MSLLLMHISRVKLMRTIFPANLLYFLSRLKSRFENSRFQTSDLNPIKSENMAFIKKTPQSSILSYQCRILFGINGVALCLLLIAVAFYMSRGIHLLALWLQIPAEDFGLEHIYIRNCSCSFALLCPHKLCSGLLPLLVDPINFMAGEDNRGKRAAEEISEEDMSVNQRL